MTSKLPQFEGQDVSTATGRLTGAGDGLSEPFALDPVADEVGDYVSFVVRTRVDQVNHRSGKNDEGMIRQHTYKVVKAARVDEDMADDVLAIDDARLEQLRVIKDGQTAIDNDGKIVGLGVEPEDDDEEDAIEPPHRSFSDEANLPTEAEVAQPVGV